MTSRFNLIRLGLIGLSFAAITAWIVVDWKFDSNISFSKESGFYNDEFELEILGGAEIKFTIR